MFRPRKPTSKRMPAHFLNYSCPMDGLLHTDRLIFTNHMYSMEKSHKFFTEKDFFLKIIEFYICLGHGNTIFFTEKDFFLKIIEFYIR
jgi:hypothetical protein